MVSRPKFALHPGWVISKTDGDDHRISAGQLARLYKLKTYEYIVWRGSALASEDQLGRRYEDFIHLYPRYDGNYGRPNDQG